MIIEDAVAFDHFAIDHNPLPPKSRRRRKLVAVTTANFLGGPSGTVVTLKMALQVLDAALDRLRPWLLVSQEAANQGRQVLLQRSGRQACPV